MLIHNLLQLGLATILALAAIWFGSKVRLSYGADVPVVQQSSDAGDLSARTD